MSLPLAEQRALLDPENKPRTRQFRFTQREVDAAATLLKHGFLRPGTPPPQLTDGLTRLFDRGLLTVTHLDHAPDSVEVTWADQSAEAAATRHLIRHYSHGAFVRNAIMNRFVSNTTDAFTPTELALILAWHYRYTGVQSLLVRRGRATIVAVEEHPQRPDREHVLPTAPLDRNDIDTVGVDDYSDEGETLSGTAFAFFVRLLARHPSADSGLRVNLDTFEVRPRDYQPDSFTERLPGLTQDALAYFAAPVFADRHEFIAWAERHLLVTVPCGTGKHRLRVDPHTHTTLVHPATARAQERRDGEHLLTALSDSPDLGCDAAARALDLFGDQAQYKDMWRDQQASMLAAIRAVARTVQYLDAGLDPRTAAPFLRMGLTSQQALTMTARQTVDSDGVRTQLLAWAKFHWNHGPVTTGDAPIGDPVG